MDHIDRKILHLLQNDASLAISEIASRVHLSTTPCWKRIRRMEQEGVIRKRVALLDAEKVGAGFTVFVSIRTNQHTKAWFDELSSAVSDMPEILEFYRMAGEVDYLLRVVVQDMGGYNNFYTRLIGRLPLANVTAGFAMEQIKYTTALPLASG